MESVDISDRIQEIMAQAGNIRAEHIENMVAAYLLKTDIDPRNVELVEERQGDRIVWYFRERAE